MKSVCLYFKIHQPFRLKRYRFFDIGNDHYYYDDFANDEIMTRLVEQAYTPTVTALLEMIKNPETDFRCAIAISGTAIEQMQMYAPEFVELLRKLADTGKVEFLAGTYSHGLASTEDPEEFMRQVKEHSQLINRLFGQKPKVINNTELILDDDIACMMQSMGFKGCVTEGAKHILGWKSPNFIYTDAAADKLKLLMVNDKLSEDISKNFNNPSWHEYPLTADKYIDWIASLPEDQQIVNIYLSMETLGSFIPRESGIFEFLKALPHFAKERGIEFSVPSEIIKKLKPVDSLPIPFPISGSDEARDVSAWKGNRMQREALEKLFSVAERVDLCTDRRLKQDWMYLQSSDHFYYMSTKRKADGAAHSMFSPYDSPFAAFTNYMNVLADFLVRVKEQYPESIDNEELNSLLLTIRNQSAEIEQLKKEVGRLRNDLINDEDVPAEEKAEVEAEISSEVEEKPKKAIAKRSSAKKSASNKNVKK